MSRPRVVAVTGNMGAGKSSLVAWLETQLGMVPFFEPNDENPYLADFYGDMQRWSFHLQVFFLSSRFKHQREMERSGRSVVQGPQVPGRDRPAQRPLAFIAARSCG